MQDDLHCNSLSCRRPLTQSAVVTTCSHVFCNPCGATLFNDRRAPGLPYICPACETELGEPDDIAITNLNPPSAYKTSVLAGLPPATIFDIATRALNFHAYQTIQEAAFQVIVLRQAQERISVLEADRSNIVRQATSEIDLLKERVAALERDLKIERDRVREHVETHKQNSRAYTKLKAQLDKLQHRTLLTPNSAHLNFANLAAGIQQQPAQPQPNHAAQQSQPQPFGAMFNSSQQSWGATPVGGGTGGVGSGGGSARRPLQTQVFLSGAGVGGGVAATGPFAGRGFFSGDQSQGTGPRRVQAMPTSTNGGGTQRNTVGSGWSVGSGGSGERIDGGTGGPRFLGQGMTGHGGGQGRTGQGRSGSFRPGGGG